jgi:antirestriction protein
MTTLYAQPYDISAAGFYFDSAAEYAGKVADLRNSHGEPVEEFEIQFIDGDGIDGQLFAALGVHQGNIGAYFNAVEEWDKDDKVKVIIAVGDGGYQFALGRDEPDRFNIDLHVCDTMRDLAMHFVDDGLFGEIPPAIQHYLDYDAIARDLSMDYGQISINGTTYIYRCD